MSNKDLALLVIDMQLVAFDGKITPPISNSEELLDNISNLIETCRQKNIPIVYLQTCAASGQPYAKDMHGWEIHPKLTPKESDSIVFKVQSNGFEDTNLNEVLTEIGAKKLISCGIWSEFCVTATSEAALELGYEVWVAGDGHSTVAASEDEATRVVAKQNQRLKELKAVVLNLESIAVKLSTAIS
jgi:nicotinamidase-related amidase